VAATKNVTHQLSARKSSAPALLNSNAAETIKPKRGVVTLFGYGIQIQVDRGHLILKDGVGANRRHARFARVAHQLERLVVIGADGMVSLAALRWLADQKAAFVMLERDGTVLATTGPVRRADARLRRAQACAGRMELGLEISRQLITLKLIGQEHVARDRLKDAATADAIATLRTQLMSAKTLDDVRSCEARAGAAYWIGWHGIKMQFPKKDALLVPEHWLTFGSRTSPLSGFSPRLAVNPLNAILNYLYAVLEAETRLAIAAMGLDPGMGFLHVDNERRDSLACDLMEVVRPDVDAFLFDWASGAPFRRDWFFEQRNGNCRLMGEFAATLSETARTWRRNVAPIVEWLARALWEQSPRMSGHRPPANRLTQSAKRGAHGGEPALPSLRAVSHQNLCRTCGGPIMHKGIYCQLCNAEASKSDYVKAAALGRKAALTADAQARRTATQRRNALAQHGWIAAEHPSWLDQDTYVTRVLPRLSGLTASSIASATNVSLGYADSIRKGKVHPHARHWRKLAELVGIDDPNRVASL
jgi:CRISPR-associated endonuclease Cas1